MSLGRVTTPSDMKGPILVRVVSSEYAGDNQWDYQVEIANWNEQKSISASQAPARNIWERENTATTAMGLPAGITADLQPCPDNTFVLAFYSPVESGYLFQWPNQWECSDGTGGGGGGTSGSSSALVQSFTGTWSSSTQYGGTVVTNTETVIDLSIGAERWGANQVRFWNGSEALNAGATLTSGRYRFATSADCRAWWDAYVIRVNVNSEGWQYINTTNSGTTTVGGSTQPAYLNTTPAVSWTGSDFSAGLAMDVEVYKLSLGGGP